LTITDLRLGLAPRIMVLTLYGRPPYTDLTSSGSRSWAPGCTFGFAVPGPRFRLASSASQFQVPCSEFRVFLNLELGTWDLEPFLTR